MTQRLFRSDDTSPWIYGFGNGADGAGSAPANVQTSIAVTLASQVATFGSFTGFSDGDLVLIHQSRNGGDTVGSMEFNAILSHSGNNVVLVFPTTHAFDTTAQVCRMKQFSSFNGSLGTPTAWDGAKGAIDGFFCNGIATLTGGNVSGIAFRGGTTDSDKYQGEGTGGAPSKTWTANGNGGGGGIDGGPTSHGGGGGGGNGTVGTVGETKGPGTGGAGGLVSGNVELTLITFGGAGGDEASWFDPNGIAGYGSGIFVVISKVINVTGAITFNGQNAQNIGAGGGAAGSGLFKGQTVNLGNNLITAIGGLGTGHDDNNGGGGPGAVGRLHVDYAVSIAGTTNPTLDSRQDQSLRDRFYGGMI